MTQYQDLIERVRAATGPDDELEAAIWLAVVPGASRVNVMADWPDSKPIWEYSDPERNLVGRYVVPRLLASIDAALALVERCLPGWAIEQVGWGNGLVIASIGNFGSGEDYRAGLGESTTAPLAILTALLLALQSNEATNVEDK